MGGQTGCARGGFRVNVRVHVRVNVQRDMLQNLTTVLCSENRSKAGKIKTGKSEIFGPF